jgi:predicted ester cyclase
MPSHSNPKQLVSEYTTRIWDKQDLSAVDELLHPEIVIHSALGDFKGIASMKHIVEKWIGGFPDLQVTNNLFLLDGEMVTVQWQAKGTHQGEFKGVKASGKPIAYSGVTLYRVKGSKIVEYWAYLDMHHLMSQIN